MMLLQTISDSSGPSSSEICAVQLPEAQGQLVSHHCVMVVTWHGSGLKDGACVGPARLKPFVCVKRGFTGLYQVDQHTSIWFAN